MNRLLFCLLPGAFFLAACQEPTSPKTASDHNPPAPGFDLEGSDPSAIALADSVMLAMGGRKAWDDTRYLGWTFFERRHLIWDKLEKRARIEEFKDSLTYLLNLEKGSGRVFQAGAEITEPGIRDSLVKRGEYIWINDSYWLAMPFKMKDSGVTLKSLGEDSTMSGQIAEVVQLTFEGVGVTPDNKYLVYIDPKSHKVTEWAYFSTARQDTADLRTPWLAYQRKGSLLFSTERKIGRLDNIMVWDSLPPSVFRDPAPPSIDY